jgi:hypothetical protein
MEGGPRFYYRVPTFEDLGRPIVLVRAGLSHRLIIDPRWLLTSSLYGSYGEVDYTASATALNTRVSARITSPVLSVFAAGGQSELAWRDTERTEWAFGAQSAYWLPLASETDIQTTLMVGGLIRRTWDLDARRKLWVPVGVRYYELSVSPSVLMGSAGVGYGEALDRRTNLELLAGATYAQQGTGPAWAPEGSIALDRVLQDTGRSRVTNRVAVFVRTTFDPTLGRVYPVAGADLTLRNDLPQDWAIVLALRASTALTKRPWDPNDADTNLAASAAMTHRLNPWLDFAIGVRAALRATHLNAEKFSLLDRELWTFVTFTALFDPTSSRPP